jgi:uncharacterized membrane protein YhaH (DUF805 family)
MNDQSPYTAPGAALSEHQEESYQPEFLTFKGRIGRLRYLAYSVGIQCLLMLVLIPVVGVFATTSGEGSSIFGLIGIGLFYVATIVFSVMFAKRRLNDLNRNGWWLLLFIVPLLNLLIAIYLIFFPGTQGVNDYGPAPCQNSLGVKLLGLILPIIFVIGIVAAIAIPAYQQYATAAQQSQMP